MKAYLLRPLPFNWLQGQILMLNKYSYKKSFSFRQLTLADEKNAADVHVMQNKGKDLYGSVLHFLWAITSVQIAISCPAENLLLGLATCYCVWTVSICECWLFIRDQGQKSVWGTCKTFNPCLLVNQGFVKSCWCCLFAFIFQGDCRCIHNVVFRYELECKVLIKLLGVYLDLEI